MADATTTWEFTDDRGQTVRTARRPERVLAYIRAGAALWDLGRPPAGVYGSGHDGAGPDPVKAGEMGPLRVPYLGAGAGLDAAALRAADADLVVDVTYDGERTYAVDEDAARAAGLPVLALAVGGDVTLTGLLARFAELAAALGEPGEPQAAGGRAQLTAAESAVRAAASGTQSPRVLVLSAAGGDQVHLARPEAWPELRHLAGLGVQLADPGPGGGANWLTTTWDRALDLGADLVLADSRGNATPPAELEELPAWRELTARSLREPWNPELPPSETAYAAFLRSVADALEILRDKRGSA
ncbi:ABC transporter substrate-binding protein [Streptomyces sp. NPDC059009]|uniref:ABC transporter substrate-binding protein n=1 Tax=Streptomyces sp. NPDC059009 TaxID=3346694 RepID=UPI0036CE8139